MKHNIKNQYGLVKFQNVLLLLPIIIACITAIPAYLSLNDRDAKVYHSFEYTPVKVPAALDESKILRLLRDNGVPVATLTISIVNQGNLQADEIKISIRNTAEAESIWTDPTIDSQPVWVNIPDLSNLNLNQDRFVFSVNDLAVNKILKIYVGYKHTPYMYLLNSARAAADRDFVAIPGLGLFTNSNTWKFEDDEIQKNSPEDYKADKSELVKFYEDIRNPIQIYYKGIQSIEIEDVNSVKPWSRYDVFDLPLKILIYGFAIIIILIILKAAITNPATIHYFSNKIYMVKDYFKRQ